MNKNLFDILVCPVCNGKLALTGDKKQLVCRFDKLAFAINDDIPNMVIEEARNLTLEELDKLELL
jgi:hypothetical protein